METKELEKLAKDYELVWDKLNDGDMDKLIAFSERYKKFMDLSKTEREANDEIVKFAEEKGFFSLEKAISKGRKINAGDKVYAVNKGKGVAMFVIGKQPLENGMNIVGSHIDSPRMDLSRTLYMKMVDFPCLIHIIMVE
jgi:aspartyl aminopeptidase